MMLRPRPARWFELLVPRESLALALEVLSRTRAVQLQARSAASPAAPPAQIAHALARFRELRRRFGAWWPQARFDGSSAALDPLPRVERALQQIERWVGQAEPRVATVESIEAERAQLARLARFFELCGRQAPRPDLLARAGPRLQVRLFLLQASDAALSVPDGVLVQRFAAGAGADDAFVLAVGVARAVEEFERGLDPARAEPVPLPAWLPAEVDAARSAIEARLDSLSRQLAPLRDDLLTLATAAALENALGDMAFVGWFATEVPQLEVTGRFAWITGWMREDGAATAQRALAKARVPQLIRYPDAPAGLEPPVTLRNPRWAAPFELFVGMLGTPGREEADPSLVLAIVAPLMFGFMFSDVGQGAVLVALGLALRRRLPLLALLVPGGLASIVFGLLFGSVFAREDLIAALWLRPIEAPLAVLAASLALGIFVIATGLAIDAFAHAGSGLFGRWLQRRAGLALAYAGGVLAVVRPAIGGAVACGGIAAIAVGAALEHAAGERLAAAGRALAEFAEAGLQLLVNTVSFLRVGAFALAHAGLSVAVVGLSEAATSRAAALLILVLGNVFILALEAMVVGIQTTRLVLFEFCIRFLRGTGQAFRPLTAAPFSSPAGYGGRS